MHCEVCLEQRSQAVTLSALEESGCLQDISPLESMHVSNSFQVMYASSGPTCMDPVAPDARNLLRASIIELILGRSSPLIDPATMNSTSCASAYLGMEHLSRTRRTCPGLRLENHSTLAGVSSGLHGIYWYVDPACKLLYRT